VAVETAASAITKKSALVDQCVSANLLRPFVMSAFAFPNAIADRHPGNNLIAILLIAESVFSLVAAKAVPRKQRGPTCDFTLGAMFGTAGELALTCSPEM
jgi:hypothetical protein